MLYDLYFKPNYYSVKNILINHMLFIIIFLILYVLSLNNSSLKKFKMEHYSFYLTLGITLTMMCILCLYFIFNIILLKNAQYFCISISFVLSILLCYYEISVFNFIFLIIIEFVFFIKYINDFFPIISYNKNLNMTVCHVRENLTIIAHSPNLFSCIEYKIFYDKKTKTRVMTSKTYINTELVNSKLSDYSISQSKKDFYALLLKEEPKIDNIPFITDILN